MAWIQAGGAILGGLLTGAGAKSGAQTQADAASQAAALQKQMFDIQNQQQAPYREAGYSALSDITGMKPYLTQQFGPEQFQQGIDPGYAFRLAQGQRALQGQQNAAGGLIGGNALAAMQDYTQGQASQEYQNAFNRFQTQRGNIYNTLASIAGLGQTSLGQTTNASGYAGANIGNQIAAQGAALGAGNVAMGNALGGAANTISNQYYLANLLGSNRNAVNLGPSAQPASAYPTVNGVVQLGSGD